MEYVALLRSIPRSYEDFVIDTAGWMEQNDTIKEAVLAQLREFPDSTPSDVLGVVWKCLGMGEPLELIDDEDEDEAEFSDKVMKVEPSEGIDDSQEERVSGRKGVRVAML